MYGVSSDSPGPITVTVPFDRLVDAETTAINSRAWNASRPAAACAELQDGPRTRVSLMGCKQIV